MKLIKAVNAVERKTIYTIEITDDELIDVGPATGRHAMLDHLGSPGASVATRLYGLWDMAKVIEESRIKKDNQ